MSWHSVFLGEQGPQRVVPSSGFTMSLTLFAAAAMAFLAVFVAAVAGGADRLGDSWTDTLSDTATVRLIGEPDTVEDQAGALAQLLGETPGIASARRIDDAEQAGLLAPWLGDDLPLDLVQLPVLFEITLTEEGPDVPELKNRLAATVPGAVYDDHERWRVPVAEAASRLSLVANLSLVLIGVITGAIIALAASASLAANGQVIDVLRLIGANDAYITRVFVRRFALRAAAGAAVGSLVGVFAVLLVPRADDVAGVLNIGFDGAGWIWPFLVPVLAGAIAFVATRFAARRRLREVS